jgi:hypothetical protein
MTFIIRKVLVGWSACASDISVSGQCMRRTDNRISVSDKGRDFSFCPPCQDRLWGSPRLLPMSEEGSFPARKRPGREAYHKVGRHGGVVVSVFATGHKSRGFKPGRGDGFLRAIKIRSTLSFGW